MLTKSSRYAKVQGFAPRDAALDPEPEFRGLRSRPIAPATGVLEHTLQSGERLDLLALEFYNDDRLWWRILDANPHIQNGGDLTLDIYEGQKIVIPRREETGR